MPRGGKRPGAGRKKGGANAKSREIADKARAEGITPLEVMLVLMRQQYQAQNMGEAARLAIAAAPYCHPRLASIQHQESVAEPVRLVEEIVIINAHIDAPALPAPGSGGLPTQ